VDWRVIASGVQGEAADSEAGDAADMLFDSGHVAASLAFEGEDGIFVECGVGQVVKVIPGTRGTRGTRPFKGWGLADSVTRGTRPSRCIEVIRGKSWFIFASCCRTSDR